MPMEMKSQIVKKIIICIIINIILISILYLLPVKDFKFQLCIYKMITGKECFNCGMTRAFLSILHLDYKNAITYNKNVVIVFPFTVSVYIYSWYKYIFNKKGENYERKN
ncbi:MAG: DUF2752 domain-containing protein [Clostridia bacterium]|nr:DUF2752 domain-containing protein [Clostridia bacterium]